jgi:hypothetical protein
MKQSLLIILLFSIIVGCDEKKERKGFTVNNSSPEEAEINKSGLKSDSANFRTRPNSVLLTSDSSHRLIPIYKLNVNEDRKGKTYFTGSNSFHSSYSDHGDNKTNNWNHNFMPGFEAMYGFNLVNVQLHNTTTKQTSTFFEQPVLIKTIYYPTFSNDTLNGVPVDRNYYMVSAYNEDSNHDGYINTDDLRRFFLFNIDGTLNSELIPSNYSVRSSQYDPALDYMYVYAVLDENNNGMQEATEPVHVYWIDLKNPSKRARLY